MGHRAPGQAPRARFPPALSPVLPGRTGGGDLYRNKSQPVLWDGDCRLTLFACTGGTLRATNRLENAAGCWCSLPGLLFCTSPRSAHKQPSAPGAFCSPCAIQAGKGPPSPLCTSPKATQVGTFSVNLLAFSLRSVCPCLPSPPATLARSLGASRTPRCPLHQWWVSKTAPPMQVVAYGDEKGGGACRTPPPHLSARGTQQGRALFPSERCSCC